MKNRYKLIVLFAFTFLGVSAYGQNKKIKKANKQYNQFEYIDAIDIYKQVAESGFTSDELLLRLSNGLFFNAKYDEAAKWYNQLYDLKKGKLKANELLRYAQSLRAVGKEKESKRVYNEFLKTSLEAQGNFNSVEDYLNIIEENSERYTINELAINSELMDFGAHASNDTLYFSSTRETRRSIGRVDAWTNQPFLDIYYSVTDAESDTFSKPKLIKGDVNTKHHESTPVITKDGSTMYFTRSNSTNLYDEKDNPITHLKIYQATKNEKGEWTSITDLSINGEHFSNAHPVLSPKEDKLYFVSNRPGGMGETDIYSVDIFESGKLGKPQNLGSEVNTKGRESFPFISRNYELYFSSDGHFGLGGYDVFYLNLIGDHPQLVNVGKPINSEKDDYAFVINAVSKKGYFSSNRSGVDNLYSLLETKSIKDLLEMNISGIVKDKETGDVLSNSQITVRNQNNKIVKTLVADENGRFTTKVNRFQDHTVRAEKSEYLPEEAFVYRKQKEANVTLELNKNVQKVETGVDIANLLNVVIYFDFDKSEIREDAKVELEKIVAVLTKYPKINLDLKAHTDSKGKANYNQKLSERRANASMQYLIDRGINKDRLKAFGLGESQPINKCSNDTECSEEEHQKNRRTEFIIKE